jgi:DNA-binding transcriptional LysR family regulator
VIDRAFAAAGVSRRVTIEVADVSTFLQLLDARLGVAISPQCVLPANHEFEVRRLKPPITWRVVVALASQRPTRAAAA